MSSIISFLRRLFFGRTYSVKENFFRFFVINIINASWMANQILIGFLMGDEFFGTFSLIISIGMLMSYPIVSGFSPAVHRHIPSYNERLAVKNAIKSQIFFLLGIFLSLLFCISLYIFNFVSNVDVLIFSFFYSFSYSSLFWLRKISISIGRTDLALIFEGFGRFCFFSLTILFFIFPFEISPRNLIEIDMLIRILSSISLVIAIYKKSSLKEQIKKLGDIVTNFKFYGSIASFSFYCIIGSLSTSFLNYFSLPIIETYIPSESLGRYSMALNVAQVVSLVSLAIGGSVFTRGSADFNSKNTKINKERFSKMILYYFLLFVPIATISCSILTMFDFLMVFGNEYSGIGLLFSLVVFYRFLILFCTPLTARLTSAGYIKDSTIFGICSTLITLFFWYYSISKLKLYGLIIGLILGYMVYFILIFIWTIRKNFLNFDTKNAILFLSFIVYFMNFFVSDLITRFAILLLYALVVSSYYLFSKNFRLKLPKI